MLVALADWTTQEVFVLKQCRRLYLETSFYKLMKNECKVAISLKTDETKGRVNIVFFFFFEKRLMNNASKFELR